MLSAEPPYRPSPSNLAYVLAALKDSGRAGEVATVFEKLCTEVRVYDVIRHIKLLTILNVTHVICADLHGLYNKLPRGWSNNDLNDLYVCPQRECFAICGYVGTRVPEFAGTLCSGSTGAVLGALYTFPRDDL